MYIGILTVGIVPPKHSLFYILLICPLFADNIEVTVFALPHHALPECGGIFLGLEFSIKLLLKGMSIMPYKKTVKLAGDSRTYTLNNNLRRYALLDSGFKETRNGNFSLRRSLDPHSPYNAKYIFKMMVSKDLSGFRMSIAIKNSMQPIDIFDEPTLKDNVDEFHFIIKNLIGSGIISENAQ